MSGFKQFLVLLAVYSLILFSWGCKNSADQERMNRKANLNTLYDWVGDVDSLGQRIVLKGHEYGIVDTNGNVITGVL